MTEQTWVLAAQAGDHGAFDQLHEALEPAILRFTRRLVGSQTAAEDITQETFLVLYTHLDAINPPEKLRPYLFRVARNKCYDWLRKQGRTDALSLDDEQTRVRVSFQMDQIAPDEATHWLLLLLEVREAIDELPAAQKQALILYSEEGLIYAEIAEVMDVTLGTVKSRLHHAKKNLRRRLKPETLLAIGAVLADEITDHEGNKRDG